MIAKRNSPKTEEVEINVSPLIDMVFILLIFFIVATSFVNEIGISPKHKDSTKTISDSPFLSSSLVPVGLGATALAVQLTEIATYGENRFLRRKPIRPGQRFTLALERVWLRK